MAPFYNYVSYVSGGDALSMIFGAMVKCASWLMLGGIFEQGDQGIMRNCIIELTMLFLVMQSIL